MAAQQRLLGGRAAALAHRDGVVAGQDLAGIALVDHPAMGGDRGGLVANLDLGRRLGDGDRLAPGGRHHDARHDLAAPLDRLRQPRHRPRFHQPAVGEAQL